MMENNIENKVLAQPDTITESDALKDKDARIDMFGESDLSERGINAALGDMNNKLESASDMVKLISLMKRRMKGEKFNPYNQLPVGLKSAIFETASKEASKNGLAINKEVMAALSNVFLDNLVSNYNTEMETSMDDILKEFDEAILQSNIEAAKEYGDIALSTLDERKEAIKKAIEKAKENNDTKNEEKLNGCLMALDESYNLNDFSEYCKTVKFKKFYFEKPNKIFSAFNFKYENTSTTINDISECPDILERHGFIKDDALKICFAFCKYCSNMNPNNMNEYTFMYYFIRNITILDRINYKNKSYDTLDDKSKKFYDEFIASLKKCVNNFK